MIRRCSRLATLVALLIALAWSTWPTTPTRAQSGPMMDPPLAQLSGDAFDQAFLQRMSLHHVMAVMMAQPVTTYAAHQELKDLGGTIIAAQTREIAQLRAWARDWYGLDLPDYLAMLEEIDSGPMPMAHPAGTMTPGGMIGNAGEMMSGIEPGLIGDLSMMADLEKLSPPRLEAIFLSLMVPHHESAIVIARLVPDRANHQELKDLAVQIIASQSAEIDQMNSWLASWYGL
jgi:uncharacterized protein (DUF305 family)